MSILLGLLALCATAAKANIPDSDAKVEIDFGNASAVVAAWVAASPVPAPSAATPEWDLQDVVTYDADAMALSRDSPGRIYHHTPPPMRFEQKSEREELLLVIAKLLHKGMERLQRDVTQIAASSADADHDLIMSNARAVMDSIEDFWRQAEWTVRFGWGQLDPGASEWGEYGVETNFWLKFRPYLHCKHTPRLGPELGGMKFWCNPDYFEVTKPTKIFSAGSGDDFTYEDFILSSFPNSSVVVADCFTKPDAQAHGKSYGERVLYVHLCISGAMEGHVAHLSADLRERFVTLPAFMERVQKQRPHIDTFHLYKANIEAYEYPLFSHIFSDPDEMLRDTWQINIEMHRMGMGSGCTWPSMLFGELLFATFMSGGFHPVSTEKWHDHSSAQDVLFVNASWFIQSEVHLARSAWKRPRSAFLTNARKQPIQFKENLKSDTFAGGVPVAGHSSETPVWFHNDLTDEAIVVSWVEAGTGMQYEVANLKPGAMTNVNSHAGHVFNAVTASGSSSKLFTVQKNTGKRQDFRVSSERQEL